MLVINRDVGQGRGSRFAPLGSLENGAGSSERRIEPAYRDEPVDSQQITRAQNEGETDDQRLEAGPIVQPSRLHGEGNEWR